MGAFVALLVVFWSERSSPVPPIPFQPARSPYVHSIAGEGIVEASSRNISIGSPFSEIITEMYVVEGDRVEAGDPLFKLDTRLLEAQAETARAQLQVALIKRDDQKTQFAFYQQLKDKRAVSQQQYQSVEYALKEAEQQIQVALGTLGEVEANLERSTIRAPLDGEILQVNVHVGEVAPNVQFNSSTLDIPYGSSQYPLILMGSVEPLNLRVDIDEDDAWRYHKGSPATAFVRGNSRMHFPLKFVRVEPYIIPKASFTGQSIQRIDTRVLQVFYSFDQGDLPIYTGQVLDVYIEASPR